MAFHLENLFFFFSWTWKQTSIFVDVSLSFFLWRNVQYFLKYIDNYIYRLKTFTTSFTTHESDRFMTFVILKSGEKKLTIVFFKSKMPWDFVWLHLSKILLNQIWSFHSNIFKDFSVAIDTLRVLLLFIWIRKWE